MNNNVEKHTIHGGIGFFGALFLVFLTLKLCGVINWSWWWVAAPLYGPIVLIFALYFLAWVLGVIFGFFKN